MTMAQQPSNKVCDTFCGGASTFGAARQAPKASVEASARQTTPEDFEMIRRDFFVNK
jgi:hypothetical protein